jgi:hypothetical protein
MALQMTLPTFSVQNLEPGSEFLAFFVANLMIF